MPDRGGGEGRGPDQADQQRRERGDRESGRPQRDHEHETHEDEADDATRHHVPRDAVQLLVVQYRIAGNAHRDATLTREFELFDRFSNGRERCARGLECLEVEQWFRENHAALRDVERRAAQEELLPRDRERVFVEHTGRTGGEAIEDFAPLLARLRARSDVVESEFDQLRQVRDARVAFELRDHRLHGGDVVGEFVEVVDAAVEQAVGFEEVAATGDEDVAETLGLRAEVRCERRRRVARQFGRLAVDHDQEGVVEDGEQLGELVERHSRRQILVE